MSLGYFIWSRAFIYWRISLSLLFSYHHLATYCDTSGGIVGKTSSSHLRKTPFFFLLASDLGNFRRVERHSQTELDHKPAICQACLKKIHGRKKLHFLTRFCELSKISLIFLLACKCDIWSKCNTCRQFNNKPTHLNFCYLWNFLIWSYAAHLDIKPHPNLWKWQLAPTAN